jgi:hypothetical protein
VELEQLFEPLLPVLVLVHEKMLVTFESLKLPELPGIVSVTVNEVPLA